jgi:hypothetical protein
MRREMLPIATATTITHMSTRRLNSVTRRCDHLHESGAGEVTLDFDELCFDRLSRQRMFDEHHSPVGVACERIAARHQPFDLQPTTSTNGTHSVVWHATRFGVAHRHRP